MAEKLCFLVCDNFYAEVQASIKAEEWRDVTAAHFPSRCGRPEIQWSELRKIIPENCAQLVVLGRACIHRLSNPPDDFPAIQIIHIEQCFHLVAGADLVQELISAGGYLMTPGWLSNWREQLASLGFDDAQSVPFFQDFAKQLIFLDTGIDTQARKNLQALQSVVDLPVQRIAVGLDHTRLLLTKIVLQWRIATQSELLKNKGTELAREKADNSSAMDMISRMSKAQNEGTVIEEIQELFSMLFAPNAIYYLQHGTGMKSTGRHIPGDLLKKMQALQAHYSWTEDDKGFIVNINSAEKKIGTIAVLQLMFPEYRTQYLNMALIISGVCALAIENARNRKKLLEAEKMASLSIMVAGVAHEVNTPLGIGVAANSTLNRQTRDLSQRFKARSMTQTDLDNYLDTALQETELIANNLDRVAQLINTFKHVAVNKETLETHSFRLKECLDNVLKCFRDKLASKQVTINNNCDPELKINSIMNDWASIFSNLLDNSLKHGFTNQNSGLIEIDINQGKDKLEFHYRDDGNGMDQNTLTKIFDPFFTSKLQESMGLGMNLVYNLITHRMSGNIQCESEVNKGVHFYIEVPL